MGSLSLLQGIIPTQGSNPGLLHCRRILYQLNHQGHPLIFKDGLKYHPPDPKETYQILVFVNSTAITVTCSLGVLTLSSEKVFRLKCLVLYFYLFFILFFNFTLLYWFCHISKWICHRYTCAPHPEPTSLLPPHTIPLGRPSAPAPSIQYRTSNLDLFHTWYYTCFNAILPNHPTLSHRVQKTVLYISVSFAVSYTGLLLPSF